MTYLLDTNACIRYLRDPNSPVGRELVSHPPSEVRLASVVMSELYRGAFRSKNPDVELIKVDDFASPFRIHPSMPRRRSSTLKSESISNAAASPSAHATCSAARQARRAG